MNDFLAFRKMISPTVIQILFWIGSIASILFGIYIISQSKEYSYYGNSKVNGTVVLVGFAYIILGPLYIRLLSELGIIFFRIYGVLKDIRDGGSAPAVTTGTINLGGPGARPLTRNNAVPQVAGNEGAPPADTGQDDEMTCPNCSARVPAGRFCGNCGTSFE